MKNSRQISETLTNALLLSVSGGLQDAYTYVMRDHVFANAQTGNVVLLAKYLCDQNFALVLRYLLPMLSFCVGIFIAEIIHQKFKFYDKFHWRQIVLLFEILVLAGVAFVSNNALANVLVSFVCALQVQSFRKVNSYPYASTMCVGNLRACIDQLANFTFNHKKQNLYAFLHYFLIIVFFGIGAFLGYFLSIRIGNLAILGSTVVLSISLLIMLKRESRIIR